MTVTATPVSAAPVTITLLNINDFHGRINANTTKFATTIEQQRLLAGEASTLLLGAGDLVGASEFASSSAQDQPTIDVLNALDLAASAVGNHEFDQGFADLSDRIIGGPTPAAWDYLGANVYEKGTTTPVLEEYSIFTVAGVTVGVIGAVTEETPTVVSPLGIADLDFGDPVEAVNRVADELSDGDPANGEAQVIIAEYHEGGLAGATTLDAAKARVAFAEIVDLTSADVDVIFTGHSHQAYVFDAPIPGGGGNRPIVQTGEYGANIGKVSLTVESTTGAVTAYVASNVPTGPVAADLTLPRVAEVKTIVDAAIAAANVLGAEPVSAITSDITTAFTAGTYTGPDNTYTAPLANRGDRTKESTLGNLVADALLETLDTVEYGSAEIGVVNPGGLRNEFYFAPDGTITYAEANAVLPFLNNLWTTSLTGAQFKQVLEEQWTRSAPPANVPTGAFLQLGLSDNVTYTFDASRPLDQRITSISIDGVPIDPAASYRIGTFSFLAVGGDSFWTFRSGTDVQDTGLIDRDGWIDYLSDNEPVSPDFARQAVVAGPLPTTATAGTNIAFSLSALDLTSLGSPRNTEVEVYIGGVSLGVVPVTAGAVAIDLAVPNTVPSGEQPLQVVASPTNTTVTIPVTVTSPAPTKPYKPLIFSQKPEVDVADQRIVDTRSGVGLPQSQVPAFTEQKIVVAGQFGIPLTAKAVAVNVTTLGSTVDGFVNVYPCGETVNPLASVLNQVPGKIVANLAIVDIGDDGAICFVTNTPSDIVIDLQTYYASNSDLETMSPVRVVDTRNNVGLPSKLAPNTPVELVVAGLNGVPEDASAVVVNLTTTDTRQGFITAYPCGTPAPLASNLNAWDGHAIANSAIVGVGTDGKICFVALTATELVVDLTGYFSAGADYNAMTPARALDTRTASNPLQSNVFREIPIAGLYGVPDQADQVAVNVTAVNATGPAFITVYSCGALPTVSSGNTSTDRIVATLAVVDLSDTGSICVLSNLQTDLVVDVQGWTG